MVLSEMAPFGFDFEFVAFVPLPSPLGAWTALASRPQRTDSGWHQPRKSCLGTLGTEVTFSSMFSQFMFMFS